MLVKFCSSLDGVIEGIINKHFTATEKTKLAGIEDNATTDQTADEIKISYESNANTNAFSDSDQSNLSNQSGINTGDETLSTIQTKRPLKTIEGQSIEGSGDVDLGISTKADKISGGTSGHVVTHDAAGNLQDAGVTITNLQDGWDGEVNTFADLPSASGNDGKKYVVKTPTGTILLSTKKYAGTYISDNVNWNIFGYKQASVINQILTGFSAHASVASLVASDTILIGFQKIQKWFNEYLDSFNIANKLVKLDGSGNLPALDGSALTNVTAGDTLTSTLHCNDNKIQLRGTALSPDTNHFIEYNASNDGVRIKSNVSTEFTSHVKITGNSSINYSYGYLNSSGNTGTGSGTTNYSLSCDDRIQCVEFNATSDARIKDIIGVSDTLKDLEKLLKINITDYTYKDKIKKGDKINKKVIAQELKKVFPEAVSKTKDFIPNIYKTAKVKGNKLYLKSDEINISDTIKIYTENKKGDLIQQNSFQIKILEKTDNFIIVDKSFLDEKIFIYGSLVDDFLNVDYDAISMLAVSAMQQQNKRICELEFKINSILTKNER